ncbi:MAG: hypothetical protein ACOCZ5_00960 [bacterium]
MNKSKFNYAPGIPGYGTEGDDGSAGLSGLSIFISTYSAQTEAPTIGKRISNNQYLNATKEKLPDGREYKNGDFFIDSESIIYVIDFSEGNNFRTTDQKFTASSTVFASAPLSGDYFDIRYINDWNGENDDNKKAVDFVASVNDNLGDYANDIDNMYGIEAVEYPHIFYSDLDPEDQDKYHPFIVYTTGTSNNRAVALLSEIKDGGDNESDWHFGNIKNEEDLRTDENRYHLDFHNVIFKKDVSINNSLISPSYTATPTTESWGYSAITDNGKSGLYRSSNGSIKLELQNTNGQARVILRPDGTNHFYNDINLHNKNLNNVDKLNVNTISGFKADGDIDLNGKNLNNVNTTSGFKTTGNIDLNNNNLNNVGKLNVDYISKFTATGNVHLEDNKLYIGDNKTTTANGYENLLIQNSTSPAEIRVASGTSKWTFGTGCTYPPTDVSENSFYINKCSQGPTFEFKASGDLIVPGSNIVIGDDIVATETWVGGVMYDDTDARDFIEGDESLKLNNIRIENYDYRDWTLLTNIHLEEDGLYIDKNFGGTGGENERNYINLSDKIELNRQTAINNSGITSYDYSHKIIELQATDYHLVTGTFNVNEVCQIDGNSEKIISFPEKIINGTDIFEAIDHVKVFGYILALVPGGSSETNVDTDLDYLDVTLASFFRGDLKIKLTKNGSNKTVIEIDANNLTSGVRELYMSLTIYGRGKISD